MTDAMIKHLAREVRDEIDQLDFNCADMVDVFQRLHHESETSQVIVAFSYVEDRLRELFELNLVGVRSRLRHSRLFDGSGPLSSFNNIILLSFHLGWISEETFQSVDALRKIRNRFAHAAFKTSYNDDVIRDLFKPLLVAVEAADQTAVAAAVEVDNGSVLRRYRELSYQDKCLASIPLIAGRLFMELLITPRARMRMVPVQLLYGAQSSSKSKVVEGAQKAVVRVLLEVFAKRTV